MSKHLAEGKEPDDGLSLKEFAHMKVAKGLIDNYIIWNMIQRRDK